MIRTTPSAQSAGAQCALGNRPAQARITRPVLWQLADRVGTRLRAKRRPGRTISVRVRFADLRAVSRSVTLPQPVSATAMLAEIAEDLVRAVLAKNPEERTISLLAISVSGLEQHPLTQLELPFGLADEARRPGSPKGRARALADGAMDKVRDRFGWAAVRYGPLAMGQLSSVPDAFRRLAEKDL